MATAGLPTAVSVLVPFVRGSDVVLPTVLATELPVLCGSPSAANLLLTVRLLVLFRVAALRRLPSCARFVETVGLALAFLLTALVDGSRTALLTALEPAAQTLALRPTLTVSLVLPTGTPTAALERGLLVAFGLLTALLTLPPPALLTGVLLSATLLSAVLLVLTFGASVSLAPPLTLRVLSLISVPVLVSLLRSSLSVPVLSASSLSALMVFVAILGSFVLVVWHGRITLLPDAD